MNTRVTEKSIAEELTALIADTRVVASFFSTYTFDREFFEREVLPLITKEGERIGLDPVTIVVDRNKLRNCGAGYEVVRSQRGRLWHAKIILLYIKGSGANQKWTIFGMGSANLTRAGWESNREFFSFQKWDQWRIPLPLKQWFESTPLRKCSFAQWLDKNSIRDKFVTKVGQQLLTSYITPLWEQMEYPVKWSEAHILSPFTDNNQNMQDDDEDCGESFFCELAKNAASSNSRLDVYLRVANGQNKTVIGRESVFVALAKRVNLWIHPIDDDNHPLHAKLFAWKCSGCWSVLIGSPNATDAGMVATGKNIESALELPGKSHTLPTGFFPKCKGYRIDSLTFIAPVIDFRKVWDVIENAVYNRIKRIVTITWKNDGNHGPHDTIVLFDRKIVDPKQIRISGSLTRCLETRPRRKQKSDILSGCVPIEMPQDMYDSDTFIEEQNLTPEEWLSQLGEPLWDVMVGVPRKKDNAENGGRPSDKAKDFQWALMVVNLEKRLQAFKNALLSITSQREFDRLERIAHQTWDAHNPNNKNLTLHERVWMEWVRAGMWRTLKCCKSKLSRHFRFKILFKTWSIAVSKQIKEFPIG